jgi:hypothetical protein
MSPQVLVEARTGHEEYRDRGIFEILLLSHLSSHSYITYAMQKSSKSRQF